MNEPKPDAKLRTYGNNEVEKQARAELRVTNPSYQKLRRDIRTQDQQTGTTVVAKATTTTTTTQQDRRQTIKQQIAKYNNMSKNTTTTTVEINPETPTHDFRERKRNNQTTTTTEEFEAKNKDDQTGRKKLRSTKETKI